MAEFEKENLNELFERFVDSRSAGEAAEDIEKGEAILREYATPEPSMKVLAKTKTMAAEALEQRKKRELRRAVYKVVAVAAVFFIVASIAVKIFERGPVGSEEGLAASVIPNAVWEGDDIVADDADIAVLTAEVNQIADELLALRLGDNGTNDQGGVYDAEMELIEINSDFWKG